MKHLPVVALVLMPTLWFSWAAPAQTPSRPVQIESTGVTDTRIPIAVPAFTSDADAQEYTRELAVVMANDLDFSGLFVIVPPSEYPSNNAQLPEDPTRINFEAWRQTKAEYLVHGRVLTAGNGDVIAEYRLFDVPEALQVVGKRLTTEARWARLTAHQFSDEIVRYLTGVPGIASTEIAFSGGQPGHKEIYISDYDGANLTRVTGHGSISIKPKFSPDGRRLAYLSFKDRYPFLYIYDRRTGASTLLSNKVGLNHAPSWAPDGNTLAFVLSKDGNMEIYLKSADGGAERRLTNHAAIDTSPTFSPDGSKIAFVSDRLGRSQIFVMNTDGSNMRRLSYQGGSATDPVWSPDGRHIAYVVEKSGEGYEIYIMGADGSNPRRLTDSQGFSESPSWSPDSRHIVFTSSRSGITQLYTVTAETGVVRRIPNLSHLRCEGPTWGPRRP